jgi:hypothetical protein
MTRHIDEFLARISRNAGAPGHGTLAEFRDHLLTAAEELEALGVPGPEAEQLAIRRFGSSPDVLALLERDLEKEVQMAVSSVQIRRATAFAIVAGGSLGASAALASGADGYAAPLRTLVAAVLLGAALIGVRRSMLGALGLAGAAGAAVCVAGALMSFDRDGFGFGIASTTAVVGLAYAATSIPLVRMGGIPPIVGVGLGLPFVAGVLRTVGDLAGGSEALRATSAALLVPFVVALAWLAYRLTFQGLHLRFYTSDPSLRAEAG